MKILAASDIHADPALVKHIAEKAEKEDVDLVVLCGDLTLAETDIDNIVGPIKATGKKMLLLPGNHESVATVDFLAEKYGAKNLHGYAVKYEDIGFFGCGGATMGPILSLSDDEIFEKLQQSFERIRYLNKKIMVTHAHPTDSKMEQFTQLIEGSKGVRKAIDAFQPDILLCGHAHEAKGIEEKIGKTRVINVCHEGRVIEF